MRLGKKEYDYLKQKYDVDRIWSYSRISTYVSEPWAYRMTYLDPAKVRTSNVYSIMGAWLHDVIQDYQEGKTNRDEMYEAFQDTIMKWRLEYPGYKFLNEKVENGYINNLDDYFKNTAKIPYEVENEKPVYVTFKDNDGGNIVFIGYLDSIYTDSDGFFHILDYKSSSKGDYIGKKLKAHSKQLQLYAIGIHQLRGIPYDKIKLEFDMMKYYKVAYLQKNGKWKDSIQERSIWVMSQEKKIRALLQENGMDVFEIDELVAQANFDNNLDGLPDYVQERFELKNCFIEAEINEEIEKEITDFVVASVTECVEKEKGDWDVEFPEPIIDDGNRFYFEQLAPELLKYHKGYQETVKVNRANKTDLAISELDALFL